MTDRQAMIRAFMAALIQRAGGVDAAAAIIGATLGHEVSKGSISKRQSGLLDWPFVEIWALEDALNDPCVSAYRMRERQETVESNSLLLGLAEVARETGEALGAVAAVAAGSGSRVQAAKELQDVLSVTARLAANFEGERT